jgi:hypothetical protein
MASCHSCNEGETSELWRSYATPAAIEACGRCLAIQRRQDGASSTEITGAMVLRTRDRLGDLEGADLRAEVARLAADPVLFVLLRVTDVFAIARQVIDETVRLERPAEYDASPIADPALTPELIEELRHAAEELARERSGPARESALRAYRARPEFAGPTALERYEPSILPAGGIRITDPSRTTIRGVLGRGEKLRVTGVSAWRFQVEASPSRFVGTAARYLVPLDLLI